jgi:murein DD-endopeptidase MepM/ murein hydrolase activator NlpD
VRAAGSDRQEEDVVQIIVVSDRFSTAKSLTLTSRHLVVGALAFAALVLSLSGLFSYLALRHAADLRLPLLADVVAFVRQTETQRTQDLVRDNLKAIATKVGQLQAQMLHLDSLGERLSAVTGIKPIDEKAPAPPAAASDAAPARAGKGGPLAAATLVRVSAEDIGHEVDALVRRAEAQNDYLAVVESTLMEQRIARNRLPTVLPVEANWNASAYGWRADPFTGQRAMHEGVDFAAEVGTPIVAAANGVVIAAESHPDYGLVVDVDHGNDYQTRYAHASRLHVKIGQFVKRGQQIAEVGSTGRSTGPHLHFEVRYKGAAVNPARFLPRTGGTAVASAAARTSRR